MAYEVVVEHLNHLGIVAEVCAEIGVAEWLDAQAPTSRQQVSVGTATVAMALNGLGLSNRQLYLVSHWSRSSLRTSPSSTSWGQASRRRISTMTAWGAHSTGSTRMM